jgi:hypothetical protein
MAIFNNEAMLMGITYNYSEELQGLQQQKSCCGRGFSVAVNFVGMATL